MSSAVDIQIVSVPNLEKIESFFKDSAYQETLEISANFNTRLCVERRLRLPFFDPQTRIAQNHSQLFLNQRQRMPGFKQGQIYTYPAPRWRKSRRQYLNKIYLFPERPFQSLRKEQESFLNTSSNSLGSSSGLASSAFSAGGIPLPSLTATTTPIVGTNLNNTDPELNGAFLDESSSLGAFGGDTSDSKDSQHLSQSSIQSHSLKDEWFYDVDMNDVDSLEDPKSPNDDEYDYDPRYGTKKRKKSKRPYKKSSANNADNTTSSSTSGAGRKRSNAGGSRAKNNQTTTNTTSTTTTTTTTNSLTTLNTPSENAAEKAAAEADAATTPTSSSTGRKRGGSTRGRRRSKKGADGADAEPPSFESAAAAVGVVDEMALNEDHGDLRNYRKYL